jgi:hypothetical protein
MKTLLLPLSILFSTSYACAAPNLNLDLSFADQARTQIVMPLKQGESASITKRQSLNSGARLTATILNQKNEAYQVEVKIEKENEIIKHTIVDIKKGEDVLLQSFNSQGVDQYKLLIKADN